MQEHTQKVNYIVLWTHCYPDNSRWDARVLYQIGKSTPENAPVTQRLTIDLFERGVDFSETSGALSVPGLVTKRYGLLEYMVSLPKPPVPPDIHWERKVQDRLDSAEFFRDARLAQLHKQEALIQAGIKPVQVRVTDHSKWDKRTVGGNASDDPPREELFHPTFSHPLPPEYALTEQQKREITEEMLAEFDRPKRLLQQHYKEMYAAILRAFPLNELPWVR